MRRLFASALLVTSTLLAACGSDDGGGEGTVSVRVYGESFIEEGIQAAEMDDGWAVDFTRFAVTIRDVVVAGTPLPDPQPIDVSQPSNGEGHELGTLTVPAGEHSHPSFTIARVEVEGTAEKDGETKSFAWVFDAPTAYAECETTTSVKDGGSATFEITIHADHLFYDSLVAAEPKLLFQPLADADSDGDGTLSEAELAQTDIGAYDPGNEDIDDLWAWLVAQHRTLGHVDGEGHCEATASGG